MAPFELLEPFDDEGNLQVVVESPRGSTLKYELDSKRGVFIVSRSLPVGVAYPYDWGFIPGTKAEDGDPVDTLVVHESPTYPGVVLACRILGVVLISQEDEGRREQNHRIIATPMWSNRIADAPTATTLPAVMHRELEQFFLTATFFTGKKVEIDGWRGERFGLRLIRKLAKAARR